jgi:hypothetical protein
MRADECERLGRENSLPVLWALFAPALGEALILKGKPAEGTSKVSKAILL